MSVDDLWAVPNPFCNVLCVNVCLKAQRDEGVSALVGSTVFTDRALFHQLCEDAIDLLTMPIFVSLPSMVEEIAKVDELALLAFEDEVIGFTGVRLDRAENFFQLRINGEASLRLGFESTLKC